jgi:hypothetical protein
VAALVVGAGLIGFNIDRDWGSGETAVACAAVVLVCGGRGLLLTYLSQFMQSVRVTPEEWIIGRRHRVSVADIREIRIIRKGSQWKSLEIVTNEECFAVGVPAVGRRQAIMLLAGGKLVLLEER